MTSPDNYASDFSRYFQRQQKVFLIRMNPERNSDVYESLSAYVIRCEADMIHLHIPHGIFEPQLAIEGIITYKLTTEHLGSGIQVLASLIGYYTGNRFQFQLHGTLELFQRRLASRVDTVVSLYQQCGSFPLSTFSREWKRVVEFMGQNGVPPGLVMGEVPVNLSAGGIGLPRDPEVEQTPLSMFFLSFDDSTPLCALAEIVWQRRDDEGLYCGYRFLKIMKAAQERINRYVRDVLKQTGETPQDFRRNWVLVDMMVSDSKKE